MPGSAKCCLTHIYMHHDGWIPSWCHIESEHILRRKKRSGRGISIAVHPVDERFAKEVSATLLRSSCLLALPRLALPCLTRSALMGVWARVNLVYLSFSKRKNGHWVRIYGLKGERTPTIPHPFFLFLFVPGARDAKGNIQACLCGGAPQLRVTLSFTTQRATIRLDQIISNVIF